MSATLDVGVVGGGTAGAAAAILLARAGHRVTVFERVARPGATGAGILLQPTGQAVLRQLGLLDGVLARCVPIRTLHCETLGGRTVFDLAYDQIPGDRRGYGLHRGVLFEALWGALHHAGATVCTGVEVGDAEGAGAGRVRLRDDEGRALGVFDLCIVADGARSRLHGRTEVTVEPHAWGALWCLLDDRDHHFGEALHQVVKGTRKMVGALPTGLGPDGDVRRVSLFASHRSDAVDAWRAAGLDAWKREVRTFIPAFEGLLDQVRSLDQVLFTRYYDVSMPRWHAGRLVFLGDAAHAMSPQLGQGANLALLDAWVLSRALADAPSVDAGLAAYTDARRSHLGFYQFANRLATLWFQSDHDALGPLRDLAFPWAGRVGFAYRAMVTTMAGVNDLPGVGRTLALP